MKKFWADFKVFITKGNVIDMAVGIIIGTAFTKIVTSLVNDVISPLIGVLTGGISLSNLKIVLSSSIVDANGNITTPENALMYGSFLQSIIDFLIIAFSIFVALRIMMNIKTKFEELTKKKPEEKPAPEVKVDQAQRTNELLEEILKKLDK